MHAATSIKCAALSDIFDCLWKDHKTQKDVKTKRQKNFGKLGPLYFPKTFWTFSNFYTLLKGHKRHRVLWEVPKCYYKRPYNSSSIITRFYCIVYLLYIIIIYQVVTSRNRKLVETANLYWTNKGSKKSLSGALPTTTENESPIYCTQIHVPASFSLVLGM